MYPCRTVLGTDVYAITLSYIVVLRVSIPQFRFPETGYVCVVCCLASHGLNGRQLAGLELLRQQLYSIELKWHVVNRDSDKAH